MHLLRMVLRNDEQVSLGEWIDVHKRENVFGLCYLDRRDLAVEDLTEDAIRIRILGHDDKMTTTNEEQKNRGGQESVLV